MTVIVHPEKMVTVRLEDVIVRPGLNPPRMTTAHDHVGRFYSKLITPRRHQSVLEYITVAPSEFALETLVKDATRFATTADRKTWIKWLRAVRLRVAYLRGEVL